LDWNLTVERRYSRILVVSGPIGVEYHGYRETMLNINSRGTRDRVGEFSKTEGGLLAAFLPTADFWDCEPTRVYNLTKETS